NRAALWAKQTGDSAKWKKYQTPSFRAAMLDTLHRNKTALQQLIQNNPADKPKDIDLQTDSTDN
ncbi:MAG TPA: hypothetical protein VFV08_03740, partial [Puia sp.]|nr:hypothetical protein [Puia sp.]